MKNCKYCGTELPDEALFCTSCGANQTVTRENTSESAAPAVNPSVYNSAPNEKYTGWCVLGFIFPLIALLCYFLWRDREPAKALAVGKGGLMSLSFSSPIVGLIVYIVMKEQYHDIAKACGICAIVGFAFGIVCSILYSILFVFLMMLA